MSVNKVILIGNVGKDPEVRYVDTNVAVANFAIATTERAFTRSNGTQVPEKTEWHNVVVWRGLAQVVEKYVKKGTQLYIEGKLRSRSYDDKDGVKRYVTEIVVDVLQLLGRRSDGSNDQSTSSGGSYSASETSTVHNMPDDMVPDNGTDDLPF